MVSPARIAAHDFRGSVAVVTGAAGDLGSAVVAQLLAAGAFVVAVDIDPAGLENLRAALEAPPGALVTAVADVRDSASMEVAVAKVDGLSPEGAIDLFFNNAGIEGRVSPIADLSADDFARVLAVNVAGMHNGLRAALPRMRAGGSIVNTASTAALAGAPGLAAYVTSKHAVLGLTRTAALEAAERGIRVNAVCPGAIEGRMMGSLDAQRADVLHTDTHAGRTYATADDVAAVVMFLFSDAARIVSGEALAVARS